MSCGEIVPKWAGKRPKQELFHRNFQRGSRQSFWPRSKLAALWWCGAVGRLKETSPHPKGIRARKRHMVGAVGLEPTILAARDFKSPCRLCSRLLPFANMLMK